MAKSLDPQNYVNNHLLGKKCLIKCYIGDKIVFEDVTVCIASDQNGAIFEHCEHDFQVVYGSYENSEFKNSGTPFVIFNSFEARYGNYDKLHVRLLHPDNNKVVLDL